MADTQGILGATHAGMRAQNERLVLTLLRKGGPLAKAEIARQSGLSAQAASVIMRALETDGLLLRGEPIRGRVGQPSVPMRLAPRGAFFLGLKVGRRSTELILTDFLGTVLKRRRKTHEYPEPAPILTFAREALKTVCASLPPEERARIAGLGVATPYFMWNWGDAMGAPPERMAAWRDMDIGAALAENFDFPVFVENDASSACGAELVFGPQDTARDFLYFYVAYFIGGGIALNGRVFTGHTGNAAALGPMPISASETEPTEKPKQLLHVASLVTLEEGFRDAGFEASKMWETVENWPDAPEVTQAWTSKSAQALAKAITAAASIIDFEEVRIDGWLPQELRAELVTEVTARLKGFDYSGLTAPRVLEGSIGPDARALGAASLPLSARYLVE